MASCNSVHPGFIWTNMQARAMGARDPSEVPLGRELVPLGGMGEAQDIADCVLHLASHESRYVTGAEREEPGAVRASIWCRTKVVRETRIPRRARGLV
jgi:NAD(P)-dependent dehydrogenase (short-subunit alcohol dehydrogenase family)